MKNDFSVRPHGAVRIGCLGYAIAIALLWVGGQELYTYLKNPKPLEVTVEEYITQKPNAEWVTLKSVHLNLLESAASKITYSSRYPDRVGQITAIYIPVRSKEAKQDAPVHIVLETRNDDVIGAFSDINRTGATPSENAEAIARNAHMLNITRDVTGLVRFGFHTKSETRQQLAHLNADLTKDFVIVSEGWKPDLFLGSLFLGLGLLIGLACFKNSRSR
jgi:hypothetical protein